MLKVEQLKKGKNEIVLSNGNKIELLLKRRKVKSVTIISMSGVRSKNLKSIQFKTSDTGYHCGTSICHCNGDNDCNKMVINACKNTKGVVDGACIGNECWCVQK